RALPVPASEPPGLRGLPVPASEPPGLRALPVPPSWPPGLRALPVPPSGPPGPRGWSVLPLRPLDDHEAHRLLLALAPDLADPVAAGIMAMAEGNPGVLTEL